LGGPSSAFYYFIIFSIIILLFLLFFIVFLFFFIELLLFYYFLRLFSFQLRLLVLVFFGVVAAFLAFDFEGRAGLALLLRLLVQRAGLPVCCSLHQPRKPKRSYVWSGVSSI
jgi:hypothetical protein